MVIPLKTWPAGRCMVWMHKFNKITEDYRLLPSSSCVALGNSLFLSVHKAFNMWIRALSDDSCEEWFRTPPPPVRPWVLSGWWGLSEHKPFSCVYVAVVSATVVVTDIIKKGTQYAQVCLLCSRSSLNYPLIFWGPGRGGPRHTPDLKSIKFLSVQMNFSHWFSDRLRRPLSTFLPYNEVWAALAGHCQLLHSPRVWPLHSHSCSSALHWERPPPSSGAGSSGWYIPAD